MQQRRGVAWTLVATTTLVKGGRASRSTITLKLLMAASGIIFIDVRARAHVRQPQGLPGHDAFNEYAHHLRGIGEPIPPARGPALDPSDRCCSSPLVVHVAAATALWRRARKARTTQYVMKKNLASSFSSRWMRWGGVTSCCS